MKQTDTSIAYQNKDIFSKAMGEHMKNKSFAAYGLDLPKIVNVEPTNLPTIQATELRIDNLFELADGSFALVDYESAYDEADKLKYAGYLLGVARRLHSERGTFPTLRMIIIYTADVARGTTSDTFSVGAFSLQLATAFLSDLSGDAIYERLEQKLADGQPLDDTDCMQFMIAPLTYQRLEEKQAAVRRAFALSKQIKDQENLNLILPGMIVFCSKIIDQQTYERMKERIRMTRMGQEFAEEKRLAVAEGEARGEARGEAKGVAASVKALMQRLKITAQEAMDLLAVPADLRKTVQPLL